MSWMMKEIHEQPDAMNRFFDGESARLKTIAEKARSLDIAFIMIVARGSSDNAAQYGKYLFEAQLGIPTVLAAPSINTVYEKKLKLGRGMVIGISQSGQAPDITKVIDSARSGGAYTIGITNTPGSPLAKAADDAVLLNVGKEKGLAATKTYTAQLMALMLFAAFFSGDRKLLDGIKELPAAALKTLAVKDHVNEIVDRYRYMEHCVLIGRGFNYSTVQEAALKFMETCYVISHPFSTADFMHGPIAIADAGFPVFICIPQGKTTKQLQEVCAGLNDKQLETIVISPLKSCVRMGIQSVRIPVKTSEILSPVINIIPFQFFACFLSDVKGLDPDNPRFLKKITCTL